MVAEELIFQNSLGEFSRFQEFDECTFKQVDFTESDFSDLKFNNCTFVGCDLSNVPVLNAAFRGVSFKDCRLMGVDFSMCNKLGMEISSENSDFSFAIFIGLTLRKSKFIGCRFTECIFQEMDFLEANFGGSDFSGARFSTCDLRKSNFEQATNYSISPLQNQLKKAVFSSDSIAGLLDDFEVIVR